MNTTTTQDAQIVEMGEISAQAPQPIQVARPAAQQQLSVTGPAQGSPTHLLLMAVDRGMSLEYLERLITLQERMETRDAEKQFNEAVALLRGEVIHIEKNKTITDGPMRGKTYADLQSWVHGVSEALSKHGLSVRWNTLQDDKDWIRMECILRHRGGHKESAAFGGPPDTSGAKNVIQARASVVSYLERYTLKMVLGLAEGGDDDDGSGGSGGDKGERGGAPKPPPPPPAAPPEYTDAEFAEKLPPWLDQLTIPNEKSGKCIAPERLIAFIESKGKRFTQAQKDKLTSYKPPF